jgi:hypothetical protein
MLLELYAVLMLVGLFLVYLGYAIEVPVIPLVAFAMLFLLSFTLINNNLEYKTGSIITDTANSTVVTNTTSFYTEYSSTIGKYMAITFALLFVLALLRESGAYDSWRENYEENNY